MGPIHHRIDGQRLKKHVVLSLLLALLGSINVPVKPFSTEKTFLFK